MRQTFDALYIDFRFTEQLIMETRYV